MFDHGALPRLLRLTGFVALLGVVCAAWVLVETNPHRFSGLDAPLWCACMLAFALLYTLATRPGVRGPSRWVRLGMCALEAGLALYANHLIKGHGFHSGLLVIVAGQVTFLLPLGASVAWACVQALAYYLSLREHWPLRDAFAYGAWALFYQVFAVLSAGVAAGEARARFELDRANTELRAARAQLEQQSRLTERLRISRELHDLLGHHLTALNMNLEVAAYDLHASRAPQHLKRASDVARLLLSDVREAVSAMRAADGADVRRGLEALAQDIPHLRVHLSVPPNLNVPDGRRAQVLLRCAGEMITNTARHARADNLWLEVVGTPTGLELRARDDGRGTPDIQLGSGLRGMRERLEDIGGHLTLASAPNQGFHVRAFVPLAAA